MKKKLFIAISICVLVTVIFLLSMKRNVDIFMESTSPPPYDKIELKVAIDDEVIFDDTLKRNPFCFPTHIEYPMRIGFHTISVSSEKGNMRIEKDVFIFFNHHLAMYCGYDTTNMKPSVCIGKGSGVFGYE